MKKTTLLAVFSCLVFSFATQAQQSTSQNFAPNLQGKMHPVTQMPTKHSALHTNSTDQFVVDMDSSDAAYAANVNGSQYGRYLWDMNMNYAVSDSSLKYMTVVFDSLVDSYSMMSGGTYPNNLIQSITIDSLYLSLGQENNSGINDTLVVQILNVATSDQPGTTVLWADTTIILANASLTAPTNDWGSPILLTLAPSFTTTSNKKFAVKLMYLGNKQDTCGFIAGYSKTSGNCGTSTNVSLCDNQSQFSQVGTATYRANTYTYWSAYSQQLPNGTGGNIYYDCDGSGGFTSGDGYSYIQNGLISAMISVTSTVSVSENMNNTVKLYQNTPNPFNGQTSIAYDLKSAAQVNFVITDILGRTISTTDLGMAHAGKNTFTLSTDGFSKGVYFYTLKSGEISLTKKMIISE